MQINSSCPFCQKGSFSPYLVAETQHFMVVCDYSPVAEGHILLVPKEHYPCYATLPISLLDELLEIKDQVTSFLSAYYSTPVFFEHGVAGQSVPHAHLHAAPAPKRSAEGDIVANVLREAGQVTEIRGIFELLESFDKIGPYLYWEQNGTAYIVKSPEIEPGYFQKIVSKWTGRTGEAERRYTGTKEFLKIKEKWETAAGLKAGPV